MSKWERGKQEVSDENWAKTLRLIQELKFQDRFAQDIPLTIGELYQEVRVEARVGAGAEVFGYEHDSSQQIAVIEVPATFGEVVAVEIVGDSMFPTYRDGDILLFSKFEGTIDSLIGQDCLIRTSDGRRFVKELARGRKAGLYDLLSLNASPLRDVIVDYACPIAFADFRKRRR